MAAAKSRWAGGPAEEPHVMVWNALTVTGLDAKAAGRTSR